MAATSEHLDRLLTEISRELESGGATPQIALSYLSSSEVKPHLDGENIKIAVRGAFMMARMFGRRSSFYLGFSAYLASRALQDPSVNYGLSLGVAHASAAAAFCMVMFADDPELVGLSVQPMVQGIAALKEDGESKGLVEALIALGEMAEKSGRARMATEMYFEALQEVATMEDDFFQLNSTQDMVRLDNKNVFDFHDPELKVPNTLCTGDKALVVADLDERLARAFLLDGNLKMAKATIDLAGEIWGKGAIFWPHRKGLHKGYARTRAAIDAAGG